MRERATSGFVPGEVLAGKYRVERIIGQGGMGVVVAAHHLQLDQRVAIKLLLPEAVVNAVAVARFVREARTAVKIQSEYVARVSDVGELENGAPFMVMEYLEGADLAEWLAERGPMAVDQAVEFVLQACVAVADAHALGIVHRDLKPANLFCARRSDGKTSIKVLDFGISKIAPAGGSSDGASMTKTSAVMGSPLYMSPEQLHSSKTVDARADIWALGVVLFELLSGRSPFVAESLMELALKINGEPPPSLLALRPDVPAELEAVLARCMQKDRAARYPHVGDLAKALLPFAPSRAAASVERISGILEASGVTTSSPPLAGPPSRARTPDPYDQTLPAIATTTPGAARGRSVALLRGVAGLLTLAGVGAIVLVMARRTPPPGPVTSPGAPLETMMPAAPEVETSSPDPSTASPASTVAPSPPAPSPPAPSQATGGPRVVKRPSKAPSTPPAAAPAMGGTSSPNCSPNFTYDADGNKIFKPECFAH